MVGVPPLPASCISSLSLGALALRMRRAILNYTANPDAICRSIAQVIMHPMKIPLLCPLNADFEILTSWRSAKFHHLNFSGGSVDKEYGEAKVICVISESSGNPISRRLGVVTEDEDALWISATRGRKEWKAIRRGGWLKAHS